MKLGVFGGTFNPIHNGHILNARYIKNRYSLDTVLFVPSKHPVHKKLEGNISPTDRFEMIRLAVNREPGFDVSNIEIERSEKSFTIITIRQLLDIYSGAEIFLLIGEDAFNEIDTWKDFGELIKLVAFIVMKRNSAFKYKKGILKKVNNVIFADNRVIKISSSDIREKIRAGLPVNNLLPQDVENYIRERGLYKN